MLKRTPRFRALLGLVVIFFSVGAMASVRADRKSVQTERNTESIQQIAFNQGLCLVTGVFPRADPEKVSLIGVRIDEKRIIALSSLLPTRHFDCYDVGFDFPNQVEVAFPGSLPLLLPVIKRVAYRCGKRNPDRLWLVVDAQLLPERPVLPTESFDGELKAGMAVWMPEMNSGPPFWYGEKRLTGTVTPQLKFQPNEPDVHPVSGAPVFDEENRLVGIFLCDDWGDDPKQRIVSIRKISEAADGIDACNAE